jgi:hypothetical protein
LNSENVIHVLFPIDSIDGSASRVVETLPDGSWMIDVWKRGKGRTRKLVYNWDAAHDRMLEGALEMLEAERRPARLAIIRLLRERGCR